MIGGQRRRRMVVEDELEMTEGLDRACFDSQGDQFGFYLVSYGDLDKF